ncbi:hypothetical protein [Streptomyces sp. NPDC056683]|uniref:hypothetical protein n=1 Tax=Streptomyces sp. NPDC056683 TaxID=3345910 RepID=UPI00367C70C3
MSALTAISFLTALAHAFTDFTDALAQAPAKTLVVVVVVAVLTVLGVVVWRLFPPSSGGLPGLLDARQRSRTEERRWQQIAYTEDRHWRLLEGADNRIALDHLPLSRATYSRHPLPGYPPSIRPRPWMPRPDRPDISPRQSRAAPARIEHPCHSGRYPVDWVTGKRHPEQERHHDHSPAPDLGA